MSYQLITDGSVITQGARLTTALPGTFSLEAGDGTALIFLAVGTTVWIKVAGVWKPATVWLNVGGTWKITTPYIKVGGVWK